MPDLVPNGPNRNDQILEAVSKLQERLSQFPFDNAFELVVTDRDERFPNILLAESTSKPEFLGKLVDAFQTQDASKLKLGKRSLSDAEFKSKPIDAVIYVHGAGVYPVLAEIHLSVTEVLDVPSVAFRSKHRAHCRDGLVEAEGTALDKKEEVVAPFNQILLLGGDGGLLFRLGHLELMLRPRDGRISWKDGHDESFPSTPAGKAGLHLASQFPREREVSVPDYLAQSQSGAVLFQGREIHKFRATPGGVVVESRDGLFVNNQQVLALNSDDPFDAAPHWSSHPELDGIVIREGESLVLWRGGKKTPLPSFDRPLVVNEGGRNLIPWEADPHGIRYWDRDKGQVRRYTWSGESYPLYDGRTEGRFVQTSYHSSTGLHVKADWRQVILANDGSTIVLDSSAEYRFDSHTGLETFDLGRAEAKIGRRKIFFMVPQDRRQIQSNAKIVSLDLDSGKLLNVYQADSPCPFWVAHNDGILVMERSAGGHLIRYVKPEVQTYHGLTLPSGIPKPALPQDGADRGRLGFS